MATITLPNVYLNFETSLANSISSSASSFVLSTSVDDAGNTLSGRYYLTINEGKPNEEHIIATLSGSAGTVVTRGISRVDGTSNIAGNQKAHDRGSSVKITDSVLVHVVRLLHGTDTFNSVNWTGVNSISGLVTPTVGETTKAANVDYVNSVALSGAPDASTTVKGVTKLTTAPVSATEPIAVGATDVATSGASKVIRSKSDSKIDDSLLGLTTAGDLVYSDGTDLQRLAKGTEGYYLRAGASAPAWGGANLDEANTFFGATDITGAEAETLTSGITTPITTLHSHKQIAITATRVANAADASVTYAHGLGATPNWVKVDWKSVAGSGNGIYGCGFHDRVNNTHKGIYLSDDTNTGGELTDMEIYYVESGAGSESGVITVDGTNITITWTKTSTPGATNIYMLLTCGV